MGPLVYPVRLKGVAECLQSFWPPLQPVLLVGASQGRPFPSVAGFDRLRCRCSESASSWLQVASPLLTCRAVTVAPPL